MEGAGDEGEEEEEPADGFDEVGEEVDDDAEGWVWRERGGATKDWGDEGAVTTNSTAISTQRGNIPRSHLFSTSRRLEIYSNPILVSQMFAASLRI